MDVRLVFLCLGFSGVCRGLADDNLDDDTQVAKIRNILRVLQADLQGGTSDEKKDAKELKSIFEERRVYKENLEGEKSTRDDQHRRSFVEPIEDLDVEHQKGGKKTKNIPAPKLYIGEVTPTTVELLIITPRESRKKSSFKSKDEKQHLYEVLYYKEDCDEYFNWIYVRWSDNVTTLCMTGLLPSTRYVFSVLLDVGDDLGKPARITVETAPEGVPCPPGVLIVEVTTENATILISLPPELTYTPDVSYIVDVCDSHVEPTKRHVVSAAQGAWTTQFVVKELTPAKSYIVKVKAKLNDTEGLESKAVFTTQFIPPIVESKLVTSSSLQLEVSPTRDVLGRTNHYRVKYHPEGEAEVGGNILTDKCNGDKVCEYSLSGLLGDTTYVISVSALTGLGYGPERTLKVTTSRPERPGMVRFTSPYHSKEETTYVLKWQPPQNGGAPVTAFNMEYSRIIRGFQWWKITYVGKRERVRLTDGRATSYKLTNLKPKSYYELKMSAENQYGRSVVSHKIFTTAL